VPIQTTWTAANLEKCHHRSTCHIDAVVAAKISTALALVNNPRQTANTMVKAATISRRPPTLETEYKAQIAATGNRD